MDKLERQKTHGVPRSDKWPKVRREFLRTHKVCAACGGNKNIQLHHIKPFHVNPDLELDPSNFLPLCEGPDRDCHRTWGHLGNFQSINVNSVEDSANWLKRVLSRPKWNKQTKQWI